MTKLLASILILLCTQMLGQKALRVSEILRQKEVFLDLSNLNHSKKINTDTFIVNILITNDLTKNAPIFIGQTLPGFLSCSCKSGDSITITSQVTLHLTRSKISELSFYHSTSLFLEKYKPYDCILKSTIDYHYLSNKIVFFAAESYDNKNEIKYTKALVYNNTINQIFTGIVGFNFLLFIFLFIYSKNKLYLIYMIYMFIHLTIGLILFDPESWLSYKLLPISQHKGMLFDPLVLISQSIYLIMVAIWLDTKKEYKIHYKYSILFATIILCGAMIELFFMILNPSISTAIFIVDSFRIVTLLSQMLLVYLVAKKLTDPGKYFVVIGSSFLLLFTIYGFIAEQQNASVWLSSWYMLGIIGECLIFSVGLGLHYLQLEKSYFTLENEKLALAASQIRLNENRLKDRLRISQDLHDHIGSTLSSIAIFSNVAKTHKDKGNNTQLRNVLDILSNVSVGLEVEMNDIIWSINPKNESLERIIDRMKTYALPVANARNIKVHFDIENEVFKSILSIDQRKNIYLIFKEAVNNAVKYSCASHIHVTLNTKLTRFCLVIQDDGIGFKINQESLSMGGNGLLNMQLRANEINGVLEIESDINRGTKISLCCENQ